VIFGVDLSIDASSVAVLALTVPAALLLFIGLGVAIAAATVVFKEIASLLVLATTGVAILGGVYFPLSVLPEPIESLAMASPFTWALELFRSATLGGSVSTAQLVLLAAVAPVAIPASLAVFDAAVTRAKRTGTLAQY
jgi:ABC-2 type transport system permease protein